MTANALDLFWELLGSVLALQGDAFRLVVRLPHGSTVAAIIVLAAGLSQEIAQSIILFINQVKPIRFIFSSLLNAVLFTSDKLTEIKESDINGVDREAIAQWQEGDRALVLHVCGGIGGNKREPAAATPLFFGHFAYGMARVVREPLTDELRFDILYYQVYTHNTDGLTAGVFHWSRYLGDRQFGWGGVRPVADLLVKLDAFTGYYDFDGAKRSPFDLMLAQLEVMTSRYRIGDGTGGTYVDPATNCAQDSNRALFASLRQMESAVRFHKDWLLERTSRHLEQARRFRQLIQLAKALKRELQPLGNPRSDWERNEYNLGSTLEALQGYVQSSHQKVSKA